jgi:deoxyribodipyrimidine photolyase-like uncharacterized protein
MSHLVLTLGNQLFPLDHIKKLQKKSDLFVKLLVGENSFVEFTKIFLKSRTPQISLNTPKNCLHRWFMEMFIDSSDWVMGPNVYGMALFSDGGIFATKPYFCGSNYCREMGGYKASESWCDGVDGLYWGFIEKNKTLFLKNPRLSMMVRTLEKMDAAKKSKIYSAADLLRKKLTV